MPINIIVAMVFASSLFSSVLRLDAAEKKTASLRAGSFLYQSVLPTRNIQRTQSFLSVEKARPNLQIAFVIDGTDSMQAEFDAIAESLGKFVNGIQALWKEKQANANVELKVSFALVVYRDQHAVQGPVDMVIPQFETDVQSVHKKLANLRTRTGAPWFHEAVDQGLYAALTELPWNVANDHTRWVILVGDASPYPEGDSDRKHSTKSLVELANKGQAEIYTIHTKSGYLDLKIPDAKKRELIKTYKTEQSDALKFFDQLSDQTGGRRINLDDPEEVDSMLNGTKQMVKIKPFSDREVADFFKNRKEDGLVNVALNERTALAILPMMSCREMSFSSSLGGVRMAQDARQRLQSIDGLECVSEADIQAVIEKTQSKSKVPTYKDFIQTLGKELDCDLVLWGDFDTNFKDESILNLRLYDPHNPQSLLIAEQTHQVPTEKEAELSRETLDRLLREAKPVLLARGAATDWLTLVSPDSPSTRIREQFLMKFANDVRAQRALLSGLNELGKSLAYEVPPQNESPANKHLESAILQLHTSLQYESDNAFAELLLSSCYMNLALQSGSGSDRKQSYLHLRSAITHAESDLFRHTAISAEIEAQYALLVSKDTFLAVQKYEKMISLQGATSQETRRAHWMLAGIRMGDWGIRSHSPRVVDLEKARQHILHLLHYWPDTPEAKFYYNLREKAKPDNFVDVPLSGLKVAVN